MWRLPHVGLYIANAILCFAYDQRVEIVDTNVLRLFSRIYGLEIKPDNRRNISIWKLAKQALPENKEKVREHNFGILDFTAEICKAKKPRCEVCPLVKCCEWGMKQTSSLS